MLFNRYKLGERRDYTDPQASSVKRDGEQEFQWYWNEKNPTTLHTTF